MQRDLNAARAFVFDFYGTLIEDDLTVPPMWRYLNDLGYDSHAELEAAFEPNGFDGCLTPAHDGDPSHDDWTHANWCKFLRLSGVPPDAIETTLGALLRRRETFEVRCAPRVLDVLRLLRERGIAVGLCSNWETPIAPYLERTGLPPFDATVVSRECGARKPHQAIFASVCDDLGVDPADAVFVGDSWSADVVGALRAGLLPVWIRHGRPPRGLERLVVEVDSVAELESALRERSPS
jgi:putative hydrolase of the HAD superfamily